MSELPFDRRELIRHLPELLEGKEPALAAPAVKRAIAEDPECRLLIRAAAETALALDSGMRRMRETASLNSAPLRRSMAVVKRCYARRMVDVFWDTAMSLCAEATEAREWWIDRLHDRMWVRRSPEDIDALGAKWVDELEIRGAERDVARATARLASDRSDPAAIAVLFDACDALCGPLEGVAIARAQARDFLEGIDAPWAELASRSLHGPSKAACLSSLATRRIDARDLAGARDCIEEALHCDPTSTSARHRTLALSVCLEADRPLDRARAGEILALFNGADRRRVIRSVGADHRLWTVSLPLLRVRGFDDEFIDAISSAIAAAAFDSSRGARNHRGGSGSAPAGPSGAAS